MKGVSKSIFVFGLSVSLALNFLAIMLFYILGFQGSSVRLYEDNILIAQAEFFLVLFGFSINIAMLKNYLTRSRF